MPTPLPTLFHHLVALASFVETALTLASAAVPPDNPYKASVMLCLDLADHRSLQQVVPGIRALPAPRGIEVDVNEGETVFAWMREEEGPAGLGAVN